MTPTRSAHTGNGRDLAGPSHLDRAAIAEWNEKNQRAREEYYAFPLLKVGGARCARRGCNKFTGALRFCWGHRVLRRVVES